MDSYRFYSNRELNCESNRELCGSDNYALLYNSYDRFMITGFTAVCP